MSFKLKKARRRALWARVLFFGLAGQGKTYTALSVAHHLCEIWGLDPETDLAVIDTELVDAPGAEELQGSAEKYEGRPCNCNTCHREGLRFSSFNTMHLAEGQRKPADFERALEVCKAHGIKIVIIDGITDCWRQVLALSKKKRRGEGDGWQTARPMHNSFIAAMMNYPGHLIVTCRAKKESRDNKSDLERTNYIPDQDSNILHDFDISLCSNRGFATVVKTRDDRLEEWEERHPGKSLAFKIKEWCEDPGGNKDPAAEARAKMRADIEAELKTLESIDPEAAAKARGFYEEVGPARQILARIRDIISSWPRDDEDLKTHSLPADQLTDKGDTLITERTTITEPVEIPAEEAEV